MVFSVTGSERSIALLPDVCANVTTRLPTPGLGTIAGAAEDDRRFSATPPKTDVCCTRWSTGACDCWLPFVPGARNVHPLSRNDKLLHSAKPSRVRLSSAAVNPHGNVD